MNVIWCIAAIFGMSCVLAFAPHINASEIAPGVLVLAGVIWFAWWRIRIAERCDYIKICLNEAIIEMNNLINAGYDASGRGNKVKERMEWAEKIPVHPLVVSHTELKDSFSQVFKNYEAIDVSIKGDKRCINQTALLLCDVLNGHILGAQIRIANHYRIAKSFPHIAAGIAELVGLHHFDEAAGRFLPGSGMDFRLVKRVVRQTKCAERIILVDKGTAYRGIEVLDRLTAHTL
jgi:hypothetical protein